MCVVVYFCCDFGSTSRPLKTCKKPAHLYLSHHTHNEISNSKKPTRATLIFSKTTMNRRTELIIFTILIMLLGSTLRELLRAPKELDRINNTVVDWFGSEQRKSSSSSSGVASGQHHHVTLSSTISDYMIKRYAPKLQQPQQPQQQQEEEYQDLSKNITVSLK